MANTANRGAGALSRFAQFAGITSKPKADDEPAKKDDLDTVDDKVDDVQDDVDDLEQKVDDLEDRIEDVEDDQDDELDEDKDMPPADKPAEQAAYRKGKAKGAAAGRKAERARAGAILAAPVAAKNRNLALHLAFETATPASAAIATLRASAVGAPAPVTTTQSRKADAGLDGRMSGKKPINVGTGGAGASGGPDLSTPQGVADFVAASAAKARGQKK